MGPLNRGFHFYRQQTTSSQYLYSSVFRRSDIDPYLPTNSVLEGLDPDPDDRKKPDILRMCHEICWEVVNLKGSGKPYDPDQIYGDNEVFENWLQCYMKEGMGNSIDSKNRTMWHDPKYGGNKIPRHGGKKKTKPRDEGGDGHAKTNTKTIKVKQERDEMVDEFNHVDTGSVKQEETKQDSEIKRETVDEPVRRRSKRNKNT